jgi:hypothetical protein|tara:strand:+ start:3980 stop:4327 length:348 start_codon:yes stop_codon:yes gene_type:complete
MNKRKQLVPQVYASFKSEPDKYYYELNEDINVTIWTCEESFQLKNEMTEEKEDVKTVIIFSAQNLPNLDKEKTRYYINGMKDYMTKDIAIETVEMFKSKTGEINQQLNYDNSTVN